TSSVSRDLPLVHVPHLEYLSRPEFWFAPSSGGTVLRCVNEVYETMTLQRLALPMPASPLGCGSPVIARPDHALSSPSVIAWLGVRRKSATSIPSTGNTGRYDHPNTRVFERRTSCTKCSHRPSWPTPWPRARWSCSP